LHNFEFYEHYPTYPHKQAIKEQVPTSKDTPEYRIAEELQEKRFYSPPSETNGVAPVFNASDPTSFVAVLLNQSKSANEKDGKEKEQEPSHPKTDEKRKGDEDNEKNFEPAPYDDSLVSYLYFEKSFANCSNQLYFLF